MSQNKLVNRYKVRMKKVKKNEPQTQSAWKIFFESHQDFVNASIIILAGILKFPKILILPYSSLDASWVIGLSMAKSAGLQFGKDIVFPFGPLGFIYFPFYCKFLLWVISASFCLFGHWLLICTIITLIRKTAANTIDCILAFLTILVTLGQTTIEYKVIFSAIILLYLSISYPFKPKVQPAIYLFSVFLMAVVSLIKFTAVMVSASVFVIVFIILIYKKQILNFVYLLGGYIISLVILWLAAGQKLFNLFAYLQNSYEVSDGYNYAMAFDGPGFEVFTGFLILAIYAVLLSSAIYKNIKSLKYYMFIFGGFVFVSYKHGLIRHDISHIYIYYSNAILLFCCMYISCKKEANILIKSIILGVLTVPAIFNLNYSAKSLIPNIRTSFENFGSAVSLVFDNQQGRERILSEAKIKMRETNTLSKTTLDFIGSKTIDVLPWDISTAFAYNLNWRPRPVFQCYSAYTAKLDLLNAEYFENENAPELLLYTHRGVDKRYPVFDAPATFRTVLNNYEPIGSDNGYVIMQKTERPNLTQLKYVSSVEGKFGQAVTAPKTDGLLFAKVYADYNLLGKAVKIFYKPPKVNIKLIMQKRKFKYKFIFPTAGNGIFVSSFMYDLRSFVEVWQGKSFYKIDAFTVFSENPAFYNENVKVEFYEATMQPVK
ncbi:MAG: hypothetical protein ABFD79_11655 [Phycisphaerales bacterium]